jgi:uncharacterized protein
MSRKILLMGLGTLLGFGGLGFLLITYIQGQRFLDVMLRGEVFYQQLMLGCLAGMIAASMAILLISRPFFDKEFRFYKQLIGQFNWNGFSIFFVSLCAGVGEELFFRGGLQPLLGLWWTSVLFVALHGYLNPVNWRISVYGVQMVFVIAGFGWMFENLGIWSAMVAHAVFDWVVISYLLRRE